MKPLHRPFLALSWMLAEDYRQAALPLLEAGEVEALEWSFDMAWGLPVRPAWLDPLLDAFASQDRLVGHGVSFSPLSAQWSPRQEDWLGRWREESRRFRYRQVSEHFGFMSAGDFHRSSPLPVPRTPETLRLGQDRLLRLLEAGGRPVGLENLAFAFGPDDVAAQGDFLDALLAPVDGFLVLDLHNLYCQACNFGCTAESLMRRYPLHRVREIHVSGGSFDADSVLPDGRVIRRDTHDGPVPEEVYALLPAALAACPDAEMVIFERLGGTFAQPGDAEGFRADFRRLAAMVHAERPGLPLPGPSPAPAPVAVPGPVPADPRWAQGQADLLRILHGAEHPAAALAALGRLGPFDAGNFDIRMVETAMKLVRKWGVRDGGQGGEAGGRFAPQSTPSKA